MSIIQEAPVEEQNPVNSGLEPYDISFYRGLRGKNFFHLNTLIQRILKRSLPLEDREAVYEHLSRAGETFSGPVNDLLFEAYRDEKLGRVERFDAAGNRVESVVYSQEMLDAKRLVFESGITNLDTDPNWKRPFHQMHRLAGLSLSSMHGEAGMNCGLGTTAGLVNLLENVGSEEQKAKWLPRLTAPDTDWHFTVGQFMSERVGGSNIGANRTTAYKQPNGKYKLVGEKWFCSNPGELWVTTARLDGSKNIGVFLVSRIKENGEVNGHHILRKKNKLGARANLSLEMEYRDVEAESIGNPRHGLANLMRYLVNNTRIQMAFLSTGCARRAYLEAREYVQVREAYGQKIMEYSSVRRSLVSMQAFTSAMELAIYRNVELSEQGAPVTRFLTQWLKSKCSSMNHFVTHEGILLHGANGTFNDFSVMPRLYVDGFMQEFWEGTHNIIAGHSVKAFFAPRVRASYEDEIEGNLAFAADVLPSEDMSFLKGLLAEIKGFNKNIEEYNRIPFLDKVFDLFVLSLFAREQAFSPEEKVFTSFFQAYLEIHKYGLNGALPADTIVTDRERCLELIQY